ncbi:SIR2 family protein [Streptomyces prunicolor]|uniref:SIR2 family protein n=1 Tax=Streptomyces prunicolor TaxID=67348 RepID=UPI0022552E9E|nr:SIR2 family protein [Streptomyces prunicolor]MCX5238228.1 SIR2 family protein [Streptomyces prunicolor]
MTLRAQDLFLFVGAGASRSVPAGLPMFDGLRRQILLELGLVGDRTDDPRASAYAELAPEVFMLALSRGGVAVVPWLNDVLGAGEPNAAHHAVARLAAAGATVWTVNFDHLIERAGGPELVPCAWPAAPADGAKLFKPHGTLGGELIVDAEAVLHGLPPAWEERLRADVAGRTVVFLGYRGFDLDFQPLWDDVLAAARDVLWFDLPNPAEDRHKRLLLPGKEVAGRLHLRPPVPRPAEAPPGGPNPSWDFVHWCRTEGLADVDQALVLRLFDKPAPVFPPLPGQPYERAKPVLQGLLGEIGAARKSYRALLGRPAHVRHAVRGLIELRLNHGGRSVAWALSGARLLPPVGRLAAVRRLAAVKRLTVLSKTGSYRAVLHGTGDLTADSLSTLWILRSAALRSSASLDAAAEAAATAWDSARAEHHPVRIAHAAFQRTLALMWADRLDEARTCLEQHLDPYAALAANRWVAWADFIRGGLAIRAGDGRAATAHFRRSEDRFQAEALDDGVASVLIARLAVLRLRGLDGDFEEALAEVEHFQRSKGRQRLRYARNHRFMRHAVLLERAEFARVHTRDTDAALRLYRKVAGSPYPLHASQAQLGLAMLEAEHHHPPDHAHVALATATRIGARRHAHHAQALLTAPGPAPAPEFFFC